MNIVEVLARWFGLEKPQSNRHQRRAAVKRYQQQQTAKRMKRRQVARFQVYLRSLGLRA